MQAGLRDPNASDLSWPRHDTRDGPDPDLPAVRRARRAFRPAGCRCIQIMSREVICGRPDLDIRVVVVDL